MARIMTTKAISQALPPPPALGVGFGVVNGSFGFAIKVSSVDERYQSTHINAQSLNRFHIGPENAESRANLRLKSFSCKYLPGKFHRDRAEQALSTFFERCGALVIRARHGGGIGDPACNSTVQISRRL